MRRTVFYLMVCILIFMSGYNTGYYSVHGSSTEVKQADEQDSFRDQYSVPFKDIMGLSGHCDVEITDYGWGVRTYYAKIDGSGKDIQIAEAFGNGEEDDYAVDIDGDGITELVSNCIFGGNGNHQVYVFKMTEHGVMKGHVEYNEKNLPGLYYWGTNAVQVFFDPIINEIKVLYSTDEENVQIVRTLDFGCIVYESYKPEDFS